MNYFNIDPNLINQSKLKQKIKLVFGEWDYRFIVNVEICCNNYGLGTINFIIDAIYEDLESKKDSKYIALEMKNNDGDILEYIDEEESFDPADFLKDMLVEYQLVSVEPVAEKSPIKISYQ